MADHEVEINGKNYSEDNKVTLKVKTLIWIIGLLISGLVTLATVGYFDIKGDVKNINDNAEKEKTEYKEEVKEIIKQELKEIQEKNIEFVEDMGEIKGDIKVILDRTMRNNDHNNGSYTPVNTITPTSLPTPTVTDRDNLNSPNP